MSFVVVTPPPTPVEQPILNEEFFPQIDIVVCRARMRIDGTVSPERLRAALVDAMAACNDALAEWAAAQVAAGFTSMADVPAPTIDSISLHLQRYERAVCALAAASLIERHRSFDATNDGHQYADKLESPIDDLRRDAHWAIADILGRARTTVELI